MASKRGREALCEARLLIVFSAAFTMSDDLEAEADGEPEAEPEAEAEAEAEAAAERQSEPTGAPATHAAARVDECCPASPRGLRRHVCVCM